MWADRCLVESRTFPERKCFGGECVCVSVCVWDQADAPQNKCLEDGMNDMCESVNLF